MAPCRTACSNSSALPTWVTSERIEAADGDAHAGPDQPCPQCIAQRTEIEALLQAEPPDQNVALQALRRWQQHKDDVHPQLSAYLRRGDPFP